jgi:hypothetical protein
MKAKKVREQLMLVREIINDSIDALEEYAEVEVGLEKAHELIKEEDLYMRSVIETINKRELDQEYYRGLDETTIEHLKIIDRDAKNYRN